MPRKTRKSKKHKFNRRKSQKIGGAQKIQTNGEIQQLEGQSLVQQKLLEIEVKEAAAKAAKAEADAETAAKQAETAAKEAETAAKVINSETAKEVLNNIRVSLLPAVEKAHQIVINREAIVRKQSNKASNASLKLTELAKKATEANATEANKKASNAAELAKKVKTQASKAAEYLEKAREYVIKVKNSNVQAEKAADIARQAKQAKAAEDIARQAAAPPPPSAQPPPPPPPPLPPRPPTAAATSAAATAPSSSTQANPQSPQMNTDSLCQINPGDLVANLEGVMVGYVTKINANVVKTSLNDLYSNPDGIAINEVKLYQYQDVLTKLSQILTYVIQKKNIHEKISDNYVSNVEKINEINIHLNNTLSAINKTI